MKLLECCGIPAINIKQDNKNMSTASKQTNRSFMATQVPRNVSFLPDICSDGFWKTTSFEVCFTLIIRFHIGLFGVLVLGSFAPCSLV